MIRVTIWNEFCHEKEEGRAKEVYPQGIHNYLKSVFETEEDFTVRTATLEEPEHGLSEEVLKDTDVLMWWGHMAHYKVQDEIAERVHKHVLMGMGFIAMHSAHASKPFTKMLGTSGSLKWRENDRERLWCCNSSHPIAKGLPEHIELPLEEMYGEPFDIPEPDELIYIGWFAGGEVIRAGCTFHRGYGRIFYFQPGHEEYPVYKNEMIQQVLKNGIRWVNPVSRREKIEFPHAKSLEG